MTKNRYHACSNLILTCGDERLHQRPDGSNPVGQFIRENMDDDCSLLIIDGGVFDLNMKKEKSIPYIKRKLDARVRRGVKRILPLNHQDCYEYNECFSQEFKTEEDEFRKHKEHLLQTTQLIRTWFPSVVVEPYFARLLNHKHNNWVISQAILNLNL
jgi:hypothetical protein